jgi:hypothetical protein
MSPRRGGFGLLHRGALKKGTQLSVGLLSLQSRWFGHLSEEDCYNSDILACLGEERRMITVIVVVVDSTVNVMSSSSSRAAIIAALELLLECCT